MAGKQLPPRAGTGNSTAFARIKFLLNYDSTNTN